MIEFSHLLVNWISAFCTGLAIGWLYPLKGDKK